MGKGWTVSLVGLVATLLIGGYGAYRYWYHEEVRASGPMAEALLAAFDPGESRQILNDIIDAHIEPGTGLDDRLAVFEANGFDCVIRPAMVRGSREMSCRRPIEGRRHCDRVNYFAYESEAGEIIESIASVFHVGDRNRIFGRCPYAPPALER